INDRLARMDGVPPGGHTGQIIRQVLPHLADRLEPIIRRVFESGEGSPNLELNGVPAVGPGQPRDWAITSYPIRDRRGRVMAVGLKISDVTDQHRMVADLKAADERQRALLKAIPD